MDAQEIDSDPSVTMQLYDLLTVFPPCIDADVECFYHVIRTTTDVLKAYDAELRPGARYRAVENAVIDCDETYHILFMGFPMYADESCEPGVAELRDDNDTILKRIRINLSSTTPSPWSKERMQ